MLQKLDNPEAVVVKAFARLFGKTPDDHSTVPKVETLVSGGLGVCLKRGWGKGQDVLQRVSSACAHL